MSITTIRSVHCDTCGQWIEDGIGTAAEVRALAKKRGWKVSLPGGQDICRTCHIGATCTCITYAYDGAVTHAAECATQTAA